MAEETEFKASFRGYAESDVTPLLSRLRNELATIRQSNDVLKQRADEVRAELNVIQAHNRDLSARLKTSPDKPSYSNLGAQFEEHLRMGEEKSDRLVSEARAETELLRQNTQAKASRKIREAEEFAQKLLAETHARVDELRLTSETSAADSIAQANVKLAEASELVSTARREAAAQLAETEREIAEERSILQRNLELERSAIAELAERSNRELSDTEESIRLREDQFERENMRYHQEAVESANRLITEANLRAAQVSQRSSQVASESEVTLTTARLNAESIIADARLLASGMVDQARIRATDLTAKTRLHIDVLLERLAVRAERLREERELLDDYVQRVTDARSTEMIVSQFEEEMHSALPDVAE